MIDLLIDIPMDDKGLDPPVHRQRTSTGRVAVLDRDPDGLFQGVEADGGRDGEDFVVRVGGAG